MERLEDSIKQTLPSPTTGRSPLVAYSAYADWDSDIMLGLSSRCSTNACFDGWTSSWCWQDGQTGELLGDRAKRGFSAAMFSLPEHHRETPSIAL